MNQTINIGSLLNENGTVYIVDRIYKDEMDETIYSYKPLNPIISNTTLECSIPESSFQGSTIRPLSTKEEIENFFCLLSSKKSKNVLHDQDNANMYIRTNDIEKCAYAMRFFWQRVVRSKETMIRTDLTGLMKSIDTVLEEAAFVCNDTMINTKRRIIDELSTYFKPHVLFNVETLRYEAHQIENDEI